MVMAVEGLEALVIVIDVPEFYGEIGGARGKVAALLVVVDIIDWI